MYLYDLSRGAAKETTPELIGRGLEGVWHSAVVAYGREYSFTKNGVVSIMPVRILINRGGARKFSNYSIGAKQHNFA